MTPVSYQPNRETAVQKLSDTITIQKLRNANSSFTEAVVEIITISRP